jgi:hypothetical protein
MFDPKPHLIRLPRRVKDPQTGQWATRFDDYLEVKWRVVLFREQCPHGVITTEEICVDLDRGYARYKATVEDGQGGKATGYGTETQADFADFCERAETRALGRALAVLGFGTQFVSVDLTEGEHVADAPVASTNGHQATAHHSQTSPRHTVAADDPAPRPGSAGEGRITRDAARSLKALAQHAFGYAEGERRLRHDLGFEVEEPLTLMRLVKYVSPERYQALVHAYTAQLQAGVDADVP